MSGKLVCFCSNCMIAGMHANTPALVKGGVRLGTWGVRKAPCQAVSFIFASLPAATPGWPSWTQL